MVKQKKQTLLLILLLALLVGSYFALKANNQHEKEKESNELQANKVYVLNLKKEDIQKISYTYEGVNYTFQKNGENWIYPADTSIEISKSNMELLASSAAVVEAVEKMDDVIDLEQYGLSEPANTVEIVTADKTYHLFIGNYNTTICEYYVYLDDSSTVYTVNSNSVTCYNKTLDDMMEKPEETETESTME